jgi:hypothetical protein
MPVLRQLLRIADRPHLPRRTIRLRLAALYGLLFTICGRGAARDHQTCSCGA